MTLCPSNTDLCCNVGIIARASLASVVERRGVFLGCYDSKRNTRCVGGVEWKW